MRKLWCAGAIAGGILLLGATPAHADQPSGATPAPADDLAGAAPADAGRPGAAASDDAGRPRVSAPAPADDVAGAAPADAGRPGAAAPAPADAPAGATPDQTGRPDAAAPADDVTGAAPDRAGRQRPGRAGAPAPEMGEGRVYTPLAADPLSGQPMIGIAVRDVVRGGSARTEGKKSSGAPRSADVVGGTVPGTGKPVRRGQAVGPIPVTGEILARELSNVPIDAMSTDGTPVFAAVGPDGAPIADARLSTGAVPPGTATARLPEDGPDSGTTPVGVVNINFTGLPLGGYPVQPQITYVIPPGMAQSPTVTVSATAPSAQSPAAEPAATEPTEPPAAEPTQPPAAEPTQPPATEPSVAQSLPAEPSAEQPSSGTQLSDTHPSGSRDDARPYSRPSAARPSAHQPSADEPSSAHPAPSRSRAGHHNQIDDPRLLEEPTEGLN